MIKFIGKLGAYLIIIFIIVWSMSTPIVKLVDSAQDSRVAIGVGLYIVCLVAVAYILYDIYKSIKSLILGGKKDEKDKNVS